MAEKEKEAFFWGTGGRKLSAAEVAAEKKIASALSEKHMDYSPVAHPLQGVSRVAAAMMGGLDWRMADEAGKAYKADEASQLKDLMSSDEKPVATSVPAAAAPAAAAAAPAAVAPAAAAVGPTAALTPPTIPGADPVLASSAFTDPNAPAPAEVAPAVAAIQTATRGAGGGSALTPAQKDLLARTVVAEAGNQPQIGREAVAHVIKNRVESGKFGGPTVEGVIRKPYQFEPHNTAAGRAKMDRIDPNSSTYQQALAAVEAAYGGGADPTRGATHFYSPKVQAKMGRRAPKWDDGTGVDLYGHRFFGGGGGPQPTAGADPQGTVVRALQATTGDNSRQLATAPLEKRNTILMPNGLRIDAPPEQQPGYVAPAGPTAAPAAPPMPAMPPEAPEVPGMPPSGVLPPPGGDPTAGMPSPGVLSPVMAAGGQDLPPPPAPGTSGVLPQPPGVFGGPVPQSLPPPVAAPAPVEPPAPPQQVAQAQPPAVAPAAPAAPTRQAQPTHPPGTFQSGPFAGVSKGAVKGLYSDSDKVKDVAKIIVQQQLKANASTDDIREYNFDMQQLRAAGKPEPTFGDWKLQFKRPPQTIINNTVNPILKGAGDRFNETMDAAKASVPQIQGIHEARKALDAGALTGAGSDAKLMGAKAAGLFGLDSRLAQNTEVLRSSIGNSVLAKAKTLGANPSNADRDYIEKVVGGSIALEEGSIRRLLDMQEKWARDSIRRANADAKRMITALPEELKHIAPMLGVEEPEDYPTFLQRNPIPAPAAPAHTPRAPDRVRTWNPATRRLE